MDNVKLLSSNLFPSTPEVLKDRLEEKVKIHKTPTTYANTGASLLWITRGRIDCFDNLNDKFLGDGNASGIPGVETDHLANNIYRLTNAIDYLGRLWKIEVEKNNELKMLLNIRILIVHSGERLSKLESLELEGYRDSQLGCIFSRRGRDPFYFLNEFSNVDYCIQIWNDKHDKTKKYNLSKVDYHVNDESYYDVNIYLKMTDVGDIILCHAENFLNYDGESIVNEESKVLPDIKNKVISEDIGSIDFNKIVELVLRNLRGGYVKENGMDHWSGFGLKRLYECSQRRLDISDEVKNIIKERINARTSEYRGDYQNENLTEDDLPDLGIRGVFSNSTPKSEYKSYSGGEKLFQRVAPLFNTRDQHDATDIDYLFRFINEAEEILGKRLLLEQSVDNLVCEYFAQSIQVKIDSQKFGRESMFSRWKFVMEGQVYGKK